MSVGKEKNTDGSSLWHEYPRPQLQRDNWTCLNGVWEYQICEDKEYPHPQLWKKVIVPFPLGSALSGTTETAKPGDVIWYRKQFAYTPKVQHTWLNFEAVNAACKVWMNGIEVGEHQGGFVPFGFDVSSYVKYQNTLLLRITCNCEKGSCLYGLQRSVPGGEYYAAQAGIYETVWLEDLPSQAVTDIKITPDYDHGQVYLSLAGSYEQVMISVFDHGRVVYSGLTTEKEYTIPMALFHAWSPQDPFLYDLYLNTADDQVHSYFGMRSFTKGKDRKGITRFCLNHDPLFLNGILYEGMHLDGGYASASLAEMRWDLEMIRSLGFNAIYLHGRVENRRWYALCDELGLLVLQDIPTGGTISDWYSRKGPKLGRKNLKIDDSYQSKALQENYYRELDGILDALYNPVSLFGWVCFYEGRGQFNAAGVYQHIVNYDDSRLVDCAGGWQDSGAGDIRDCHGKYSRKKSDNRITILGRFGGYVYNEAGHGNGSYGTKKFRDKLVYNEAVLKLFENEIFAKADDGLSGCFYEQFADYGDCGNGLLTSDRKVLKLDAKRLMQWNARIGRKV